MKRILIIILKNSSIYSMKFNRLFTLFPCPFLAIGYILVYLYVCPSYDESIINRQGYGLDRNGTWKRGN